MALTRARALAGDAAFMGEATAAIGTIVGAPRDRAYVFKEVRTMRSLIAREKGDSDPWDMKLAAGALTDLDFIAQGRFSPMPKRPPPHRPPRNEETVERWPGSRRGPSPLPYAHTALHAIFQWQRLTIEGAFDPLRRVPKHSEALAGRSGSAEPKRFT
jgi:glutamate-ammonia-ligase adenylyltransferase